MHDYRTARWVVFIICSLFMVAAHPNAESKKVRNPTSPLIHYESLNKFLSSDGSPIDRADIHTILFAVSRDNRQIGAAVRIANNLFLSAAHILNEDVTQHRIHSYTTMKSAEFSILARDEFSDLALLETHQTPIALSNPIVRLASDLPKVNDSLSYFLLLNHFLAEPYEAELRGKPPFKDDSPSQDFYLGRLIGLKGSFTYEIEGFAIPYDKKQIEAHLERNRIGKNTLYGPEILRGPEYELLTTINGFNGASGGGVFKRARDGYELVGILTNAVTERNLITLPESPRGFTQLQQNYSILSHRKAIESLLSGILHRAEPDQ